MVGLAGCSSDSGTGDAVATQPPDLISYWDDSVSGGKRRIVIDLDEQRAFFYKGDKLAGLSIVSTGREGWDTPPGDFEITEKDRGHVSSLFGDYVDANGQVVVQNVDSSKDPRPPGTVFQGAPMPYFLRIHGGIGMHAGYLPGYPASHGCIRLPEKMAIHFFENADVGTPVTIREEKPPVMVTEPTPFYPYIKPFQPDSLPR
ncbi:MAG: L,D-transpeptidase [Verrucomicrobia bacterium]|nr:L,D-transpeptidase [Verrucomicrobiota bacterium]